jgi:hypothetical protein
VPCIISNRRESRGRHMRSSSRGVGFIPPTSVGPALARCPGGPVARPTGSREAVAMLTPKVTELTRAGSPWVSLPRMEAPAPKRPAAVFNPAGR